MEIVDTKFQKELYEEGIAESSPSTINTSRWYPIQRTNRFRPRRRWTFEKVIAFVFLIAIAYMLSAIVRRTLISKQAESQTVQTGGTKPLLVLPEGEKLISGVSPAAAEDEGQAVGRALPEIRYGFPQITDPKARDVLNRIINSVYDRSLPHSPVKNEVFDLEYGNAKLSISLSPAGEGDYWQHIDSVYKAEKALEDVVLRVVNWVNDPEMQLSVFEGIKIPKDKANSESVALAIYGRKIPRASSGE